MKTIFAVVSTSLLLSASQLVVAVTPVAPSEKTDAVSSVAKAAMTEGEVRKVDNDAGKVTIRHREIKNLDMPAMTMVFRVNDSAMLDVLKVGDKIKFTAEKVKGNFTLTQVEKAK